MPRKHKASPSNGHSNALAKKAKDKPTYKIIVLGSGGVGKVGFSSSSAVLRYDSIEFFLLPFSRQ